MPHSAAIRDTLAFVERHGYALLFFWVLTEQSAIPLPSIPLLLAAGALIRGGRLSLLPALACCMAGALLADTIWFIVGRLRGRQALRLLCRVSLEPDSCVRQTEGAFARFGLKCLLASKFIPGLNAVAAPLAGNSRVSYGRFVPYDCAGSLIWSGAYIGLGYLFSEQLESVLSYASRMGSGLLVLVGSLFGGWIGWKLLQRRRFIRQLAMARISPEELRGRLDAGEEMFIVDVRDPQAEPSNPIPGAVRITLDEIVVRHREIPRDRDIVLFCS